MCTHTCPLLVLFLCESYLTQWDCALCLRSAEKLSFLGDITAVPISGTLTLETCGRKEQLKVYLQ